MVLWSACWPVEKLWGAFGDDCFVLSDKCDLKKWCFSAKCLFRVDILGKLIKLRFNWLSSKTVDKTMLFLMTGRSMRSDVSRRSVNIGINSLIAMLNAMHSVAVELRVMSVWSFLDQMMGHPKRVRENLVQDLTLTGSWSPSCPDTISWQNWHRPPTVQSLS